MHMETYNVIVFFSSFLFSLEIFTRKGINNSSNEKLFKIDTKHISSIAKTIKVFFIENDFILITNILYR